MLFAHVTAPSSALNTDDVAGAMPALDAVSVYAPAVDTDMPGKWRRRRRAHDRRGAAERAARRRCAQAHDDGAIDAHQHAGRVEDAHLDRRPRRVDGRARDQLPTSTSAGWTVKTSWQPGRHGSASAARAVAGASTSTRSVSASASAARRRQRNVRPSVTCAPRRARAHALRSPGALQPRMAFLGTRRVRGSPADPHSRCLRPRRRMSSATTLLEQFTDEDVDWMLDANEERHVAAGETVIAAGEPVDCIYVVLEGCSRSRGPTRRAPSASSVPATSSARCRSSSSSRPRRRSRRSRPRCCSSSRTARCANAPTRSPRSRRGCTARSPSCSRAACGA